MKIYKFGGASVKDADSVKNVSTIVSQNGHEPLVVVVSAMGKTTNALEELVAAVFNGGDFDEVYQRVYAFHYEMLKGLYPSKSVDDVMSPALTALFEELSQFKNQSFDNYGKAYDSMVPYGELISTTIIHEYLSEELELPCKWLDTRRYVITNSHHRRATVNWSATEKAIQEEVKGHSIFVVQGFIGADEEGNTTTLGREGSDYTASVFAYCTRAESVTIWKDVPAVLNGDPKVFNNTIPLQTISYKEAIELAYYGASVIHPKTIQPLQQLSIPLHVKSFLDYSAPGTTITEGAGLHPFVPCFIRKEKQILITLSTHDLAFIVEDHLSTIYQTFHDLGVSVNMTQSSAISSSFCVNFDPVITPKALKILEEKFEVKFNDNLELFTIRHYNPLVINGLKEGKEVLVEQISRNTFQMVCRAK